MVAPHEGHEEAFPRVVADELHGVFDGLRATDVELHTAFHAERSETFCGQLLGHKDFFRMQILARKLRQLIQLSLDGVGDGLIAIAEADRRVPHLQVEIGAILTIVEKAALATLKKLGHRRVMDRIAV